MFYGNSITILYTAFITKTKQSNQIMGWSEKNKDQFAHKSILYYRNEVLEFTGLQHKNII